MSASSSAERQKRSPTGRRTVLALLALGPLAACGKKGSLRLPKPGEAGYQAPTAKPRAQSKTQPETQPETHRPETQPETQP